MLPALPALRRVRKLRSLPTLRLDPADEFDPPRDLQYFEGRTRGLDEVVFRSDRPGFSKLPQDDFLVHGHHEPLSSGPVSAESFAAASAIATRLGSPSHPGGLAANRSIGEQDIEDAGEFCSISCNVFLDIGMGVVEPWSKECLFTARLARNFAVELHAHTCRFASLTLIIEPSLYSLICNTES
jgi:hypothetical protein